MRIGIDCRTILDPDHGEKAGVGHYTYYLLKYLLKLDKTNQYVLFYDHRSTAVQQLQRKNVELVRFGYSKYKKYLPYAYAHVYLAQVLHRAKLDLFHAPANVFPLQYKQPTVVTVHDLAIYQHPEWFPPKQNFAINTLVPKSIAAAAQIIAVSQSTADDVIERFHVPQHKISVVYEGYEPSKLPTKLQVHATLKKLHLSDRYFLYIGTLEPRKNIAGLIAAFDHLVQRRPKRYRNTQLVLAGAKGFHFEDNYQAIQAAKFGRIRYVGYVSAQTKLALLAGAQAFVFPSLYEGFGLPVVEAMACGVPVITSQVSSLPEVVGKAAVLVKPTVQTDLENAFDKVMVPATQERLRALGKIQAAQFSWERCAQETLDVYKKVTHAF